MTSVSPETRVDMGGGGDTQCQDRSGLARPDKSHPGVSKESVVCFLFELGKGRFGHSD